MNTEESFSNSTYEDEMHLAERELSAFISAVRELFGAEQALLAPRLAGRIRLNG